ncbi:MAG: TadE/TadG family type IV pilus assembly protein [Anaerolineae bacterium]
MRVRMGVRPAVRSTERQVGQSLAELALCLPLLLVLLVGVADFGRVFYALITVENSARQGARYAASHYSQDAPDFTSAETMACNEARGSGLANPEADVVPTTRGGEQAVMATVRYRFSLFTGLLGIAPFDITGTAEMVVLEGN